MGWDLLIVVPACMLRFLDVVTRGQSKQWVKPSYFAVA